MIHQDLTDTQLAIELLIKLGGIHCATGVSIGRSWRSALREAIMSLISNLRNEEESKCDFLELIEEANRRNDQISKQKVLFDSSSITIHTLPDWWLTTELLYHLQSWYEEDAERPDSLFTEKRIVDAVCLLLCLPSRNFFDANLLLLETNDRFCERVQHESPCL